MIDKGKKKNGRRVNRPPQLRPAVAPCNVYVPSATLDLGFHNNNTLQANMTPAKQGIVSHQDINEASGSETKIAL